MRCALLSLTLGAFLTLPTLAQDSAIPAGDSARNPAANEHAQPQAQPHSEQYPAQTEPADGKSHGDPNCQWHNGRWWYWQNGGWLMWNGSRWLNPQERSQPVYSYRTSGAFYYMQDSVPATTGYVPTYAGMPRSGGSGLQRSTVAPGTVEYQRVIPSYGKRSAGAKILGNY